MCQQGEGERRYFVGQELREIRETYRKHCSGEAPLSEDQLKELCIRKLMLEDN